MYLNEYDLWSLTLTLESEIADGVHYLGCTIIAMLQGGAGSI